MTDPRALAEEDLAAPRFAADDAGAFDDGAGWDGYLDADGSYLGDEWTAISRPPAPAPSTPWFRNPALLFGLIAVAAAALVVASVLLITGRQSGEIPTAPHLSTRATPSSAVERSTAQQSSEPSATATSSPVESSPSEAVESVEPGAPQQPAQPAAPAAPPPAAEQTRIPTGPNLNVTRTPMSFTPGKH